MKYRVDITRMGTPAVYVGSSLLMLCITSVVSFFSPELSEANSC